MVFKAGWCEVRESWLEDESVRGSLGEAVSGDRVYMSVWWAERSQRSSLGPWAFPRCLANSEAPSCVGFEIHCPWMVLAFRAVLRTCAHMSAQAHFLIPHPAPNSFHNGV